MTSASRTQRSFTPPHGYPYFTGALIDVLENGVPGAGPALAVHRFAAAGRGAVPGTDPGADPGPGPA
ncbi:hypothetical protein LT493_20910 [Streptomyces tricolor]|nr:hypothetical protein [Streptomyces tricolor]